MILLSILIIILMGGCAALAWLWRKGLQANQLLAEAAEKTKKSAHRTELKNARDLDMARRIQTGLLATNRLQHRNFQLSGLCQPAEKIGGDFFILGKKVDHIIHDQAVDRPGIIRLQSTKEESLHFAIGDVSGHGVASALVMILAKSTLEELFAKQIGPRAMMLEANRRLLEYTEGSAINFVTAFAGEIDAHNGSLTYSKAGHTAPLLFRKSGEVISLETEGVFLGMFNSPEYEEKSILLEKGDKIFLYTDGLSEAKNAQDELLGSQRLTEIVRNNLWLSGENFFQKIIDDVKDYAGQTVMGDDITMVLVEVT
jgi:serine phosphatase RsbU (regulator of sigma subunit)